MCCLCGLQGRRGLREKHRSAIADLLCVPDENRAQLEEAIEEAKEDVGVDFGLPELRILSPVLVAMVRDNHPP